MATSTTSEMHHTHCALQESVICTFFCYKYAHLYFSLVTIIKSCCYRRVCCSYRKIIKIVATRCRILKLKCTKFVFGRGSARIPLGSLRRSPWPPSRWGAGYPLPILHPSDGTYGYVGFNTTATETEQSAQYWFATVIVVANRSSHEKICRLALLG